MNMAYFLPQLVMEFRRTRAGGGGAPSRRPQAAASIAAVVALE
jgi:hypothetical protein